MWQKIQHFHWVHVADSVWHFLDTMKVDVKFVNIFVTVN